MSTAQLTTHTSPGEIAGIVIVCVIFGGLALFLCDPNKVVPTEVMMQRQRERKERQAVRRAAREAAREMEQRSEALPQYTPRPRTIAFAPGTGSDPRTPPPAVLPPPSTPPRPASPLQERGAPNLDASASANSAPTSPVSTRRMGRSPPPSPNAARLSTSTTTLSAGRTGDDQEDDGSVKEDDEDGASSSRVPISWREDASHSDSTIASAIPAPPPPTYCPSADLNV